MGIRKALVGGRYLGLAASDAIALVSMSDNIAANNEPGGAMPPKPKIRIMVADDHPIFRDGLCKLLALQEDFQVVAQAQDGEQALDVLQQHEPDILLLDLNMPKLDGLATLRRMQAAKSTTRVIVLTASDDEREFRQAMKFGAAGIVLKQTASEVLFQSIRKVYEGEIWLDPPTKAAVIQQFVEADDTAQPALAKKAASGYREATQLSKREREIVALVAQGFKNKELAEKLLISEQTVKNHLHNIFDKLGVSDRLELALYAVRNNLHTGGKQAEPNW